MSAIVLDPYESDELIKRRRNSPAFRWDEVWDGVYVIPPMPDILHREIAGLFICALYSAYGVKPVNRVFGHCNVSDRNKDWMHNVRCPDVAVFLADNRAKNRRTHWQGGPDFVVEVVMPGDRCREKLDFYAKIGTGEVLILDRDPWQIELYRLAGNEMELVGTTKPGERKRLTSAVVPLSFQLLRGRPRPKVKIVHTETVQEWVG